MCLSVRLSACGRVDHSLPSQRKEKVDVLWVMVIGVAFIGIFTSWFGTQSFAVKLLNTGVHRRPECSHKHLRLDWQRTHG